MVNGAIARGALEVGVRVATWWRAYAFHGNGCCLPQRCINNMANNI